MKLSGVTILQGVEFSIFPIDFEWALQQCSATALPVMDWVYEPQNLKIWFLKIAFLTFFAFFARHGPGEIWHGIHCTTGSIFYAKCDHQRRRGWLQKPQNWKFVFKNCIYFVFCLHGMHGREYTDQTKIWYRSVYQFKGGVLSRYVNDYWLIDSCHSGVGHAWLI